MVLVVSLMTNDQTRLLEETHQWVRSAMHLMGPLMALVGDDPHWHSEDYHPVAGLRCETARAVHQAGDDEEGHGVAGGSVGLHEAVGSDVLRVHVVHSEWTDDRAPENRGLEGAPGVATPVHDSRDEVHDELGGNEANQGGEGLGVLCDCGDDKFRPECQAEGQVGSFPRALPPRVAIGFEVSIDPAGSWFPLLALRAIVSHQVKYIVSTQLLQFMNPPGSGMTYSSYIALPYRSEFCIMDTSSWRGRSGDQQQRRKRWVFEWGRRIKQGFRLRYLLALLILQQSQQKQTDSAAALRSREPHGLPRKTTKGNPIIRLQAHSRRLAFTNSKCILSSSSTATVHVDPEYSNEKGTAPRQTKGFQQDETLNLTKSDQFACIWLRLSVIKSKDSENELESGLRGYKDAGRDGDGYSRDLEGWRCSREGEGGQWSGVCLCFWGGQRRYSLDWLGGRWEGLVRRGESAWGGRAREGQIGALYIQMINYQLNWFSMKKEEKGGLATANSRPVYRYELQATNQILKDTLELCQSSLYSTAHTRHHNLPPSDPNDDEDVSPLHRTPFARPPSSLSQHQPLLQHSQQALFPGFCQQKNDKKLVFQEFGYMRSSFHRDKPPKSKNKKGKEEQQFDGSAFLNSQIYSFSSENDHHRSNKISANLDKSVQSHIRRQEGSKKELKKQRRGLAEISLKVKNIVAKMGKMTFKEVSDQVLKESQDDLPNDAEEREKETKNIRRRVYDALNVLVSVDILGKQQRCVVHTEATNIPGKKLSQHWHIINQKNRMLQQKQGEYNKKLANLNLLKKNIQMVQLFHERNRRISQNHQKKQESTRFQMREQFNSLTKWCFPLVFLVPPKSPTNKIKIQIQYQEQQENYIKKITIDNNDYILTDLDVLKYLSLNGQHRQQKSAETKTEVVSVGRESRDMEMGDRVDRADRLERVDRVSKIGRDLERGDRNEKVDKVSRIPREMDRVGRTSKIAIELSQEMPDYLSSPLINRISDDEIYLSD